MSKKTREYHYHVKVFFYSHPDDPFVFDIDDIQDIVVDLIGFCKIRDLRGDPHNYAVWELSRIELVPFKAVPHE